MVSESLVGRVSAGVAAVTCIALYLEARGVTAPRMRRPIAALLMFASVTTYFHFFELRAGAFYHRWEMFHYFLGSKYAEELGFDRLYTCSAVAEAESGKRARVVARRIAAAADRLPERVERLERRSRNAAVAVPSG